MSIDLLSYANSKQIRYFLINFTDLAGCMRSKLVPAHAISSMQKTGAGFAGFATHLNLTPADADMFAIPDVESLIQLPWKPEVAWMASNTYINGEEVLHSPRNILKKIAKQAHKIGYILKTGVECEFFLLNQQGHTIADHLDHQRKPCYDQHALMRHYELIKEISDYMFQLGWNPYQADHEDANGQFEMNWGYADCMVTADRHAFFKFMVRTLAEQKGLRASFMPKPFSQLSGNGCHIHFSLWDANSDRNIFVDQAGELGLSKLAYHFLGGILDSVTPFCAIANPTVNSYRRINAATTQSGATWSPNTISYTGNNRTHMIRIPDSDRFELRLPDGAANPYLLPAGLLALGLNGIRNKLNPGQRCDLNGYDMGHKNDLKRLPESLLESINELDKSKLFRELLGDDFVNSYIKIKKLESAACQGHVSDWERNYYMDV